MMDLTQPEVVASAIAAGRARFASGDLSIGYAHRKRPVRGIHEPVIYYVAHGDSVKIGTSRNILTRVANLSNPEILAIEAGGEDEEAERHALFKGLHMHGEWFRLEDPLVSYIKVTADAFERDFGASLDDWIWELKMQSRGS